MELLVSLGLELVNSTFVVDALIVRKRERLAEPLEHLSRLAA